MSYKWMRSILLLITYTAVLVLVLVKIDVLWALLGKVLSSAKPLLLGFGIAFVLNRPCTFFCQQYQRLLGPKGQRTARPLAVCTSYAALIVVIVALFSFVLPKVVESMQLFAASLSSYIANLQSLINQAAAWLDQEAWNLSGLSAYLKNLLDGILNSISTAASHVMVLTSGILSMLVTLTLAVVFSIYMLSGRERLLDQGRRLMRAYVPRRQAANLSAVIRLTADTFTNFVSGQMIEACILGGLCTLGMLFIQADYAPLVGVIIGVSALIPVAGAYVGAFLAAFLLVMVSPAKTVIFLVFLVVLQQIEGNVIYPKVVGTSIGLPGIWVLAAVTIGGGLFGLLGVLLSVPTASVLYTLLKMDVKQRLAEKGE